MPLAAATDRNDLWNGLTLLSRGIHDPATETSEDPPFMDYPCTLHPGNMSCHSSSCSAPRL
jgi:hypothetical protein